MFFKLPRLIHFSSDISRVSRNQSTRRKEPHFFTIYFLSLQKLFRVLFSLKYLDRPLYFFFILFLFRLILFLNVILLFFYIFLSPLRLPFPSHFFFPFNNVDHLSYFINDSLKTEQVMLGLKCRYMEDCIRPLTDRSYNARWPSTYMGIILPNQIVPRAASRWFSLFLAPNTESMDLFIVNPAVNLRVILQISVRWVTNKTRSFCLDGQERKWDFSPQENNELSTKSFVWKRGIRKKN